MDSRPAKNISDNEMRVHGMGMQVRVSWMQILLLFVYTRSN